MTDVSKVALRLYRQSMHESLSTMHAYANVHREVWSSRLGTHMESHYRTTTTIGVSSLDVYSNAPPWIEPDPNHTTLRFGDHHRSRKSTLDVDFHEGPAPGYSLNMGCLKVRLARENCEELIPQPRPDTQTHGPKGRSSFTARGVVFTPRPTAKV